ncbi:MAG: hypothetical protein HYW70_03565 [Candidatus Nealsonbacteria bacterium]|nr:hypothetical protein [Candidatus Nealsonbacteria bacterium]
MDKKIIIILIAIVVVAGLAFFVTKGYKPISFEKKESLSVEQDLSSVSLTSEEQQVLAGEGIKLPSGVDQEAKNLQSVRSSDDLSAIEADMLGTDLSGLDAELQDIQSDLSGF